MARMSLPPGFRFHPTDVELVMYYLKRKLMGKKLSFESISELNLYKFCPWDLPDKSCLRSKDLEWFFFCPREKKYASGARTNRATENGYWKTTGKDRPVIYKEKTVGMVKTLVFHLGHAPRGERTDWVMHEYRIVDTDLADAGVVQDAYVLCKVFQKGGPGPKNGAQYGAPFNEEEWEDDADICAESSAVAGMCLPVIRSTNHQNSTPVMSMIVPRSICSMSLTEPGSSTAGPFGNDALPDAPDDDDITSLLAMFTEESSLPVGSNKNEESDNTNRGKVIEAVPPEGNDIYNGLGNLGNWSDLNEGEFNISSIQGGGYGLNHMLGGDDTSFLELSDLETPLNFSLEATGSKPYDIFSAHYNCHGNFDQLFYGGNFLGTLSALNQSPSPALLEGSCWQGNDINLFQEENGSVDSASQGYSSTLHNVDLASNRQPEGSRNAAQAQPQIKGEEQRKPYSRLQQLLLESIPMSSRADMSSSDESFSFYGGSSFHVKAEVTPRVGGRCTKDALLSWGCLLALLAVPPMSVLWHKVANFSGFSFCLL